MLPTDITDPGSAKPKTPTKPIKTAGLKFGGWSVYFSGEGLAIRHATDNKVDGGVEIKNPFSRVPVPVPFIKILGK